MIDKLKQRLTDLGEMTRHTRQAEQGILERAQHRLDEVNAQLPGILQAFRGGDQHARQHYLDLIAERGQLLLVIARAKQHLPA